MEAMIPPVSAERRDELHRLNILALSVKGKAKVNKESVQLYDVERPKKAATAVANPDGSKYGDHQLCGKDRDVVRESTYILSQHATVIDLFQVTSEPTVSQILLVIGGLIRKLEPSHTLKYGGASVFIINTDVQDAMKRFANDLIKVFQ
ncbi:hypothetical protein CYMTET_34554 [Cymbomonas tetramitiformis]|uniref:Uncharacterized protein n=1 Tax=Cymbomonas tetramitiformis TaxID=36881 RepID=A0AAE0FB03_9CHLO|nr:hypothetical protein CYMTET_34554 [Cymbomonas tetramitiformis]